MKTSFFTAIILGVATLQYQAEAVSLQSHDFDFGDYELAEIEGEGKGDSTAEPATEGDQSSGIKLNLGGASDQACCPKPKLPFDQ